MLCPRVLLRAAKRQTVIPKCTLNTAAGGGGDCRGKRSAAILSEHMHLTYMCSELNSWLCACLACCTCLHRGCEEDVKREQGGCDHDGTEIGTGGMRGTYPAIVGRKGRNDRPPSFPASLSSSTSTGWSFSSKGDSRVGGVGARRPSLDTIQWSARNMMRISVSYTLNRKP
jgi:hypothetical protein